MSALLIQFLISQLMLLPFTRKAAKICIPSELYTRDEASQEGICILAAACSAPPTQIVTLTTANVSQIGYHRFSFFASGVINCHKIYGTIKIFPRYLNFDFLQLCALLLAVEAISCTSGVAELGQLCAVLWSAILLGSSELFCKC